MPAPSSSGATRWHPAGPAAPPAGGRIAPMPSGPPSTATPIRPS
jgi:hypothetical protein